MMKTPGYLFHPSLFQPPIGHAGLDISLCAEPVDRVFDTESADFFVRLHEDEEPSLLRVASGAPPGEQEYRLAPGRFWLNDRYSNVLEGFVFGGNLRVVTDNEHTACYLTSPAPLFELDPDTHDVERTFVDEIEALTAIERAETPEDEDLWLPSLLAAEPFQLFVGYLVTIDKRLAAMATAGYDDSVQLRTWVRRAIKTLRDAGEWPEHAPTLDDLEASYSPPVPDQESGQGLSTY